jgi:hypothetical protein
MPDLIRIQDVNYFVPGIEREINNVVNNRPMRLMIAERYMTEFLEKWPASGAADYMQRCLAQDTATVTWRLNQFANKGMFIQDYGLLAKILYDSRNFWELNEDLPKLPPDQEINLLLPRVRRNLYRHNLGALDGGIAMDFGNGKPDIVAMHHVNDTAIQIVVILVRAVHPFDEQGKHLLELADYLNTANPVMQHLMAAHKPKNATVRGMLLCLRAEQEPANLPEGLEIQSFTPDWLA